MWFSKDEALRLVAALTRDVERKAAELADAERIRADLLAQLHGQEIPARDLAAAAGLSSAGYYRLIREADGSIPALPRVLPESRDVVRSSKPAQRITETKRIRVA